jgi:hypothetical protein
MQFVEEVFVGIVSLLCLALGATGLVHGRLPMLTRTGIHWEPEGWRRGSYWTLLGLGVLGAFSIATQTVHSSILDLIQVAAGLAFVVILLVRWPSLRARSDK